MNGSHYTTSGIQRVENSRGHKIIILQTLLAASPDGIEMKT